MKKVQNTQKTISMLSKQNKLIEKNIETIHNASGSTLNNTISSLVQGAMAQANITSFNPIINANIYSPLTLNWTLLTYMYKTHGILQTAIDVPVLDALRDGIIIHSDELDPDDIKDLEDDLEEFGVLEAVTEATIWKRLYGGGAIIINTNQDPETPLSYKNLRRAEFYACNRWELDAPWNITASQKELNPWLAAAYRMSDYYNFYGQRIHASRVLTLSGKVAPYIIRWQLQGWGMSEYERMVEDFNAYIKNKEVLYDLLHEAKIDVYRLEGLKNQLISSVGTNLTQQRIELMNKFKNFNNAVVLDKMDEFDQKQLTFSGMAELMKENRIGIASALRMPISKIFGIGASGFSSGEDDIENYNSMVKSEIRTPMRRILRKILNIMCVVKFGSEFDLSIEYHPLRDLSAVDEEAVKTSKQNRYVQYYDRGLMTSEELGQISNKEKLVPMETKMSEGLLDDHPAPLGVAGDDPQRQDPKEKKDYARSKPESE